MDESFQLRARRMLGPRTPAPLDFEILTATLSASAAASEAARAQARAKAPPAEPIDEILLGGESWREAVSAQRGCFNRTEVKRSRNTP